MTITYVWSDVRDRAVVTFGGELPGAETENAVIEVFERRPALVVATVEAVAEAKSQGKVRSGWAILRSRLRAEELKAEHVASEAPPREKRIAKAEQWMRATGKHYDSPIEIMDELFDGLGGDRAEPLLKPWKNDDALRQRMVTLWNEVHPEGVLIREQELERAERWKTTAGFKPTLRASVGEPPFVPATEDELRVQDAVNVPSAFERADAAATSVRSPEARPEPVLQRMAARA